MAQLMMTQLRQDVARACYRHLKRGDIVHAALAIRYLIWIYQAQRIVQQHHSELQFLMRLEADKELQSSVEGPRLPP